MFVPTTGSVASAFGSSGLPSLGSTVAGGAAGTLGSGFYGAGASAPVSFASNAAAGTGLLGKLKAGADKILDDPATMMQIGGNMLDGGEGGGGGGGGGDGPVIEPRKPEPYQPVALDMPYLNPQVDPYYSMHGAEPLYWGPAQVRKLNAGGRVEQTNPIAAGVDEKTVKAIRARYRSKDAAVKDMAIPGSLINQLNIRDPNSPVLEVAFGYTSRQGKKQAEPSPFARFGTQGYAAGGPVGDGMSDSIPAMIDGRAPAALSANEYVVPADVVAHLGNGSSEAGARQLDTMLDRVRRARTGRTQQAPQINAGKFLPL
jgi:hypothetical protein